MSRKNEKVEFKAKEPVAASSMTWEELQKLWKGLEAVKSVPGGNVKWAYLVTKNLRVLFEELSIFEEIVKPVMVYNIERENIRQKYPPRVEEDTVQLERMNAELDAHASKNKDIVDKAPDLLAGYHAARREKAPAAVVDKLMRIPLSLIPNGVTADQLDGVFSLVEEGK